jgi:hypothetical protein
MAKTRELVKAVAALEPENLRREIQETQERERVLRHLLRAAESSQRVRQARAALSDVER